MAAKDLLECYDWTDIRFRDDFWVRHCVLFNKKRHTEYYFNELERVIEYDSSEVAKVRVFGKYFRLPRSQTGYGDPGLTYSFSGVTVYARPWNPLLLELKEHVEKACGVSFNFVLVINFQYGRESRKLFYSFR